MRAVRASAASLRTAHHAHKHIITPHATSSRSSAPMTPAGLPNALRWRFPFFTRALSGKAGIIDVDGGSRQGQSGMQWTAGDEVSKSPKCDPYEQGGKPLSREEATKLCLQVPEWKLADDALSISRSWRIQSLLAGSELVNKVAILSQNEGHSPRFIKLDMERGKENLTIVMSTPRNKGLTYADFMLAMKISMMQLVRESHDFLK